MAQTQTSIPGPLPADSLERGRQIYDEIMARIEPELMTDAIDGLKEKYKAETPEESGARSARYDAAFAEYDKQYAAYMLELHGAVRSLQRQVRAGVESDERAEESQELQNLESTISAL
jgi:hypothetical protein